MSRRRLALIGSSVALAILGAAAWQREPQSMPVSEPVWSGDAEMQEPVPSALPAPRSTVPVAVPASERRPIGPTLPVTIDAPASLSVGGVADIAVSVDADRPLAAVQFVLHVDEQRLAVRSAVEGGWAGTAGARASFETETNAAESAITVRCRLETAHSGVARVATIQVQALAAGPAVVHLEDIRVVERGGRELPTAIASAVPTIVVTD
jgi:hypothetical protein